MENQWENFLPDPPMFTVVWITILARHDPAKLHRLPFFDIRDFTTTSEHFEQRARSGQTDLLLALLFLRV